MADDVGLVGEVRYVLRKLRLERGGDILARTEGEVQFAEYGVNVWGLAPSADVMAVDLRAGAAMVIAGLAAEGTTEIGNIRYIERGYENIVNKLTRLGAEISLIEMPDEA